jgi:hypothetical protein
MQPTIPRVELMIECKFLCFLMIWNDHAVDKSSKTVKKTVYRVIVYWN